MDWIIVRGAREHNLKNIDVQIPRGRLVVFTGVSGSGKSSLAFDTIFAEGQRRYVESLSVYARQFLGQVEKPDVDAIDGLSPAIAIDQKGASRNPRSTVGTVTEIYDFLRLLFARVGTPHCPLCGRPLQRQTPSQMVDAVLALPEGSRILILAPVVRAQKGEHQAVLDDLRKRGFVRVRVNGEVRELDEPIRLEKFKAHTIEVVVDRLVIRRPPAGDAKDKGTRGQADKGSLSTPSAGSSAPPPLSPPAPQPADHPDRIRLSDSIETALKLGAGQLVVQTVGGAASTFSEQYACELHGPVSLGPMEPRDFSFNSPQGACPTCGGLGQTQEVDPSLLIPDRGRSLREGAVLPWSQGGKAGRRYYEELLESLAEHMGFSLDAPVRALPPEAVGTILYGSNGDVMPLRYRVRGELRTVQGSFEGVVPSLRRRLSESADDSERAEIAQYMTPRTCPACAGARLRPELLAVTIAGRTIADIARMTVSDARRWAADLLAAVTRDSEIRDSEIRDSEIRTTKPNHPIVNPESPNPESPNPESPNPESPNPESPNPESPNPESRISESPNPESRIANLGIAEPRIAESQIAESPIANPGVTSLQSRIAAPILKEVRGRLAFLVDVGLGYLDLNRAAGTLSGGESQRIRLATQVGAGLSGVLYVLDEPSIGLHPRDHGRLLETLRRLRDLGNSVLVVEHDEETIRCADWVVDIGPGAGARGGELLASGPLSAVIAEPRSLTGQFLGGRRGLPVPQRRRAGSGRQLVLRGCREHNLQGIDVSLPLGTLTVVTGVSGSGKSSLVVDTLYPRLAQLLHGSRERAGAHDAIYGVEHLDKVIAIDQSPIGRTPRSNPATYTKVFDPIRNLFAATPEARARGYDASRFSFNVKGGRCEHCGGEGLIQVEMQFLPDLFVPCEVCHGARYNRETLDVRYRGRQIAEVLDMTVEEAARFFERVPAISERLETLLAVGLGYVRLGQPANTLSGGEAQRIKLAGELARRATGRTCYILDEPTTGLHFADIERLLHVLQRLVDAGNTVLVIEHNLDVIKSADWVIDIGPEGGGGGGRIVAAGPPEQIAATPGSHTGAYLRAKLAGACLS